MQSADLTVTALTAAGVPIPDSLGGTALRRGDADGEASNSEAAAQDRLRQLLDFDEASHEVHPLVPPFFNGVVYTQIAIYLLAAVVWRRDFGSTDLRLRLLRITRRVAVVAATRPRVHLPGEPHPVVALPRPDDRGRAQRRAVRGDHLGGRAAGPLEPPADRAAGRRSPSPPCSCSAAT